MKYTNFLKISLLTIMAMHMQDTFPDVKAQSTPSEQEVFAQKKLIKSLKEAFKYDGVEAAFNNYIVKHITEMNPVARTQFFNTLVSGCETIEQTSEDEIEWGPESVYCPQQIGNIQRALSQLLQVQKKK